MVVDVQSGLEVVVRLGVLLVVVRCLVVVGPVVVDVALVPSFGRTHVVFLKTAFLSLSPFLLSLC